MIFRLELGPVPQRRDCHKVADALTGSDVKSLLRLISSHFLFMQRLYYASDIF
jgi:hypothetical protein